MKFVFTSLFNANVTLEVVVCLLVRNRRKEIKFDDRVDGFIALLKFLFTLERD